jgi:phosphatidylinositol-3-phosphatase
MMQIRGKLFISGYFRKELVLMSLTRQNLSYEPSATNKPELRVRMPQRKTKAISLPSLACLLFVSLAAAACGGGGGGATPTATAIPPSGNLSFSNVFIVVEEDHSYSSVVDSSSMPYLNRLISQYGLATQYFANTHPSLLDYLWLASGSNDGITVSECETALGPLDVDNAVRELNAAGVSWRAYMENMPSVGFMGCSSPDGLYVMRHNPFAYFSDVVSSTAQQQHMVPFTQFATDLANNTFAHYNFISPNLCNDANTCSLSVADSWLQTNIDPLLSTPMFQPGGTGVLIITFEEGTDRTNGGGQVAWVVVSPLVRPGYRSNTFFQHQSTLRLMLQGLGLTSFPQGAATAPEMTEFFN